MRRRFIVPSLAAAMVLSTVSLPATGQEATPVEVTLLHDTHVHGKYVQTVGGVERSTSPATSRSSRSSRKRPGATPMFLANGDDIGPSVYSGLFEPNGIHMIEALNEAPIDVNTIRQPRVRLRPGQPARDHRGAEFPYVTANVRDIATGEVFGADLGVEEFLVFNAARRQRRRDRPGSGGTWRRSPASVTTPSRSRPRKRSTSSCRRCGRRRRRLRRQLAPVRDGREARSLTSTTAASDHLYAGDHCGVTSPSCTRPPPARSVSLARRRVRVPRRARRSTCSTDWRTHRRDLDRAPGWSSVVSDEVLECPRPRLTAGSRRLPGRGNTHLGKKNIELPARRSSTCPPGKPGGVSICSRRS